MNEDQVIGSIHALQWAINNLNFRQKSRNRIYNEIRGLERRLADMRGEKPPLRSRLPQVVAPLPDPTPEDLALREERARKRQEMERDGARKVQAALDSFLKPMVDRLHSIVVAEKPALPQPTWKTLPYSEPAYLPESPMHLKGRQ